MTKVHWKPISTIRQQNIIPSSKDVGLIKRNYGRFILLILAVVGSLLVWWFVQRQQAWIFSETEYVGLVNLEKSQLDNAIADQFGLLIHKINPDSLEEKLRGAFVEIGDVRAEKLFPNKIRFTIVEKIPAFVYINFNGYYLVDSVGEVIKAYPNESAYDFSDLDYELARGFGSPNANYIEDRVLNELSEDEIAEFDFETFEYEQKELILQSIELERKLKFNDVIRTNTERYSSQAFQGIPLISGWSEEVYKVGENMEVDLFTFFNQVNQSKQNNMEITFENLLWDGDQRMILFFNIDSEVVISRKRDVAIQFEDLALIVKKIGEIDKIKRIDLSVAKVVVDYR